MTADFSSLYNFYQCVGLIRVTWENKSVFLKDTLRRISKCTIKSYKLSHPIFYTTDSCSKKKVGI